MLQRLPDYFRWVLREYFEKDTVQDIYNNLGAKHDTIVDYPARVSALRKGLLFPNKKFISVLDIACGTGAVIDALPDKKRTKVLGIDFSDAMLVVAKKRLRAYPNIQFKRINFMSATFPASSFDLITIANSIRFVPKGQEEFFAKKIALWLMSKGMFIAFELSYPLMNESDRILALFGLPRGQNRRINNVDYFIKLMSQYLVYEGKQEVATQDLFHKTIAVYFRKK